MNVKTKYEEQTLSVFYLSGNFSVLHKKNTFFFAVKCFVDQMCVVYEEDKVSITSPLWHIRRRRKNCIDSDADAMHVIV